MIHNESYKPLHPSSLGKCLFIGAAIASALAIGFFLFLYIVAGPGPSPGILAIPVLTVTAGGMLGGINYYLMDFMRWHGGWKKVVANTWSVLVFIVCLYLSLVFGLAQIGLWD